MSSAELAAPKQSLFEIERQLHDLFDICDTAELPEEREAAEQQIQNLVANELAKKVDGIGFFVDSCDKRREQLAELKKAIAHEQEQIDKREEYIRDMVHRAMDRLGITKLKGNLRTISIRSGCESVELIEGENVPVDYCTFIPAQFKPDKAAIRKALKAGQDVPGARLVVGPETIQIR